MQKAYNPSPLLKERCILQYFNTEYMSVFELEKKDGVMEDDFNEYGWQEVRRSGLLYCGTFVSAVHRHPPPQVVFSLLLEGHLCSPLASKSNNKWPAVTEMWWSTVTWHTSELFSNCASEEKCNGSNFQHPASDNPLTGCLHSCGPSAGFVCLIRACSEGAYCRCKSCNTMALISQMHSNDWESILEWD